MSYRPRAIEIEQQLAQLRWRRLQNERSIRNYLETTKVMKQKDTILGLSIDQSAEKIDWLDSVVRDELTRPLVLTDTEIHQVEVDEHRVKQRLIHVRLTHSLTDSSCCCWAMQYSPVQCCYCCCSCHANPCLLFSVLMQYSENQLDSLNKLIERTAGREMHTEDGKRIQAEQLQRFQDIRKRLQVNLDELQKREPYVKVKYAVAKMYF